MALAGLAGAGGHLAGTRLHDGAQDAATMAAEAAETIRKVGQEALGDAEEQARRIAGDLGEAARKNPIGAAAVAFAAGLIVGLMSRR